MNYQLNVYRCKGSLVCRISLLGLTPGSTSDCDKYQPDASWSRKVEIELGWKNKTKTTGIRDCRRRLPRPSLPLSGRLLTAAGPLRIETKNFSPLILNDLFLKLPRDKGKARKCFFKWRQSLSKSIMSEYKLNECDTLEFLPLTKNPVIILAMTQRISDILY